MILPVEGGLPDERNPANQPTTTTTTTTTKQNLSKGWGLILHFFGRVHADQTVKRHSKKSGKLLFAILEGGQVVLMKSVTRVEGLELLKCRPFFTFWMTFA